MREMSRFFDLPDWPPIKEVMRPDEGWSKSVIECAIPAALCECAGLLRR